MADYTTIDDIVSGVTNATQLREMSKNDEDTDTIVGVDWFSYAGVVCENLYANGNSWIGFGSSNEHLKVNERDAAMYNLWREEGTYLGTYKFLRIRWGGCTKHNAYGTQYFITYDVILFDTGDIMLYMADVPTDYYDGNFYLGSVEFTSPTKESKYVSFYIQSDETYSVSYEKISLQETLVTKYLIRENGMLYTIKDDVLIEVQGELNSSLFKESGFDTLPESSVLVNLSSPEILCWTNSEIFPTLSATIQGMPIGTHEIISDEVNIGHESIYGMIGVDANSSDESTFLFSFDGGNWMVYADGKWSVSDVGMTGHDIELIPSNAWSSVMNSAKKMKIKALIDGIDTITELKFNFNNEPVAREYDWGEVKERLTWRKMNKYTWKFFKGVD